MFESEASIVFNQAGNPPHTVKALMEIVEYGPHEELMAQKGFYSSLSMSQFKGKAPGGTGELADFVST